MPETNHKALATVAQNIMRTATTPATPEAAHAVTAVYAWLHGIETGDLVVTEVKPASAEPKTRGQKNG